MKKMLMAATVPSMIGQFNIDNIKMLQKMGYEVHVACDLKDTTVWTKERIDKFKKQLDEMEIKYFQIDFTRNPLKWMHHKKSYLQLRELFISNKYSFVHCHTPVASVICRMTAHSTNTKCIYTAHGFHFYRGAPIFNWLLFYPIEKFFSRWTDILITINQEDYQIAKKRFCAKKILYIPGVGVDIHKIDSIQADRNAKRKELGIPENAKLLISVGELSTRKNHQVVLEALKKLNRSDIYYVICGSGEKKKELIHFIKEKRMKNIRIIGFRNDVIEICKAADVFILPSLQEGLPVALMEAMACKLPCIVSKIRGNTDLIQNGDNEFLFSPHDIDKLAKLIEEVFHYDRKLLGHKNRELIQKYNCSIINERMRKVYRKIN